MPRQGRRLTWYERQKKRKSSPFFRLLQHSFQFRLLVAAVIALLLLAAVNRFETCQVRGNRPDCISYKPWSIISVSNIESFSIVTAALLYILEKRRRKETEHGEAAERVINSQQLGIVHSIARIDALETLNEDGLPLDGIDLQGANLEGLSIPYGCLRGVNLSRTVLIGANLQGTDLTGANLTSADLTGANLTDAILTNADLTDAILTGTILDGTKYSDNLPNLE
jgi:Pentapeptide repeats (8 copies)